MLAVQTKFSPDTATRPGLDLVSVYGWCLVRLWKMPRGVMVERQMVSPYDPRDYNLHMLAATDPQFTAAHWHVVWASEHLAMFFTPCLALPKCAGLLPGVRRRLEWWQMHAASRAVRGLSLPAILIRFREYRLLFCAAPWPRLEGWGFSTDIWPFFVWADSPGHWVGSCRPVEGEPLSPPRLIPFLSPEDSILFWIRAVLRGYELTPARGGVFQYNWAGAFWNRLSRATIDTKVKLGRILRRFRADQPLSLGLLELVPAELRPEKSSEGEFDRRHWVYFYRPRWTAEDPCFFQCEKGLQVWGRVSADSEISQIWGEVLKSVPPLYWVAEPNGECRFWWICRYPRQPLYWLALPILFPEPVENECRRDYVRRTVLFTIRHLRENMTRLRRFVEANCGRPPEDGRFPRSWDRASQKIFEAYLATLPSCNEEAEMVLL